MPRVLGIDPGTVSIDLCGLEDGRVFLDTVVPSGLGAADEVVSAVAAAGPLDLVLGPSGYGLPLLPVDEVGERELMLAFLPGSNRQAHAGIEGLRALIRRLATLQLPVLLCPGAIHLPTIPLQRKANRIDLGTADKVCAVALAIHDQAKRLGIPPAETGFILVELGGAFSAVMAVEDGAIVDGLGGSSGPPGYLAGGALDGEVACLLGHVGKDVVFSGGAAYLAGAPRDPPDTLAARDDPAAVAALALLVEGTVRAVAGELALVPRAREILLSGRLLAVPGWAAAFEEALGRLAPVRRVGTLAEKTKHAAQGAAILADGLAGGRFLPIVRGLRLTEARGTVLDYLHVAGAAEARARLLECRDSRAES